MLKVFLISKEEAFHICDKSQYQESTLWEKIKLNFRYLWCRATRMYVKRNSRLTKHLASSKLECLEQRERQLIEDRLNEHLNNQMQDQP